MLKHIGIGEEFECFVVRIGDRDVIVFASEGFDRREILPVGGKKEMLSLIHISEPTRLGMISYAVFCLKKKDRQKYRMPSSP